MKSTTISLLTLGLVLTFAPSASKAQPSPNPPGQISYQGFLTDANGFPLATNNPVNYNVQFRIYNASTAGTLRWGESQVVTVDRGYFTVMLGNGSVLSGVTNTLAGIFSGSDASDRYLEMTVQGLAPAGSQDMPIQPRLRLLTTPYSYLASKALSVDASTPIADGNLSANVALRAGGNTFNGNQEILGNVGINDASPGFPLTIGGGVGDKISLWGDSGNHYGFGIQGNQLQIFTDKSASDVVFGYGQSTSLTETMRITGTGKVGIGTGTNVAAKLDVRGDVKMQGGSQGNTVFATGSAEDLLIVRGTVGANGVISAGSGFSVNNFNTGYYTISFNSNTYFSGVPTVVVTPALPGAGNATAAVSNTSQTGALVVTSVNGNSANLQFNFIAIGAR